MSDFSIDNLINPPFELISLNFLTLDGGLGGPIMIFLMISNTKTFVSCAMRRVCLVELKIHKLHVIKSDFFAIISELLALFQRDRGGPERFWRHRQAVGAQRLPRGEHCYRAGRVLVHAGRGRTQQMPRNRS